MNLIHLDKKEIIWILILKNIVIVILLFKYTYTKLIMDEKFVTTRKRITSLEKSMVVIPVNDEFVCQRKKVKVRHVYFILIPFITNCSFQEYFSVNLS